MLALMSVWLSKREYTKMNTLLNSKSPFFKSPLAAVENSVLGIWPNFLLNLGRMLDFSPNQSK